MPERRNESSAAQPPKLGEESTVGSMSSPGSPAADARPEGFKPDGTYEGTGWGIDHDRSHNLVRNPWPVESAALTLPPLGPIHVKQGINQYEWHVYEGSVLLGTKPTQREALAFMDGFEKGYEHRV